MQEPSPAKSLRVATRSSQLALTQTEEALASLRALWPGVTFETIPFSTPGDRDLSTPLSDEGVADDFFTRDLDRALLENKADLAIHSAKDLPQVMPQGLAIAALLPARDIRDALVLRKDFDAAGSPRIVGTSSPRREEAIRTLFPDAEARPLRGAIPERLAQLDAGDYDAIIVAACALERLGLAGRISRYMPYDPTPQQGRLAIVVREDAAGLRNACRAVDVRKRAGLVAIVGCPADSAHLSDRARDYLDQADIILHDRLLPDAILLRIRDKAEPVGKAGGEPSIVQSEIHRRLLEEAEQGKLVVRLQGGDPCIFGHLAEELAFLRDWGIRSDVVPTLTAAQAAAARARTPLTHRDRGRGVTLLSGHPADDKVTASFPGPEQGNLAVYMGVKRLERVTKNLAAAGWSADTPVAVAERIGYKDERVIYTTLDALEETDVDVPAVFLVGMRAFPPAGVTLFVGTEPAHFLRFGPLIHWPLIRLVARPIEERAEHLRRHLDSVRGVIFPGRFAVRVFMEALMRDGDARTLAGKKLLAVGPATADEMAQFGLRADIAADTLGGMRDLVKALAPDDAGRYLYPCSDAAPREERREFLAGHGIDLAPEVFYMNRAMPFRELPRLPFERVLFTSSSTVKVYFESYPDELKQDRAWVAVGPSTLRTLEELGLRAEMLES